MPQRRVMISWVSGLLLSLMGCVGAQSPTSGKLVILWTADGAEGRSFDLKLYNKGTGPLHVERIAVMQDGQVMTMTSSHFGPHSLEAGAECTVHITLPTGANTRPRQLVVESDGTPTRELTLPLDLLPG